MHTHPMQNSLVTEAQREIVALMQRLAQTDGSYATAIAPLTLHRASAPTPSTYGVQKPTFCLVAQGCKQAQLGDEVHLHDPARFLLVSVDLPLGARIVQATPSAPYLGFCLDIDPRAISSLLLEMEPTPSATAVPNASPMPSRSLSLSPTNAPLLDTVVRLLRLLEAPQDIPMLAAPLVRELLYRLLSGEQGSRLREIAVPGSMTQRVAQAAAWLRCHYARPLRMEALAEEVCMSVSSLHHHFKAVTSLSPLQYQKRLRLEEARRLMASEALDAASAAYQVGYQSPSQFSREYSRLFGTPPMRDMQRLRGVA